MRSNEGRERLARYLARPAIASERLSLDEHGRVLYRNWTSSRDWRLWSLARGHTS